MPYNAYVRRVGIYSGTFDPIHAGHIAFAMEALRACGLDEVIFLPERRPRGKHDVSDVKHRAAQIRQALPDERLRVVVLPADTFTVAETLPQLQAMFSGSELTLLVGSDVVRTFPYRWDGLDILLQNVSLAIGMRDDDEAEITTILQSLEKQHAIPVRYNIIRTEHAHLASSHLRAAKS
jgi:nicotinate-nucleotide adenylyltransferase